MAEENSIAETRKSLATEGYEERIVGWVDILGFSEFSREEENFETIKYLIDDMGRQCTPGEITESVTPTNTIPKINRTIQPSSSFWSDTAVMSLPYAEQKPLDEHAKFLVAISIIIDRISEFQCKLLFNERFTDNPMLTRGCLTAGKIFHNNPIIFGPAISDAHDHETKAAIYPRVIVSNKVIEIMDNTIWKRSYFDPSIKKDSDGFYYINYLYYYIRHRKEVSKFCSDLQSLREKAKENIKKPNLSVASKWRWLCEYIDRFAQENNISLS